MKYIIFFHIAFYSTFSVGSPLLQSLCNSALSSGKEPVSTVEQSISIADIAKLAFLGDRYIGVEEFKETSTKQSKRPSYQGYFILPKIHPFKESMLQASFENAKWAYLKMQRDRKYLANSESLNECFRLAESIGLSEDSIEKYESTINFYFETKAKSDRNDIFNAAKAYADKAGYFGLIVNDRLSDTIEQISMIEKDRRNLVFVLHADRNGVLTDFDGSFVLPSFFQKLEKSRLKSIAIYSCHPKEVARFYSQVFDDLSQIGTRVYFPKLSGPLEKLAATPLNLLPRFLDRLIIESK